MKFLVASCTLASCAFDASTSHEDLEGEADDLGPAVDTLDPGTERPPMVYLAVGEETRKGERHGSLIDAAAPDGRKETIHAVVDKDREKIDHNWFFDPIPAGFYSLQVVAWPHSHEDTDFILKLKGAGPERGHVEVMRIQATAGLMSYTATLDLAEESRLELKVALPREASALDEDEEESDLRRIDIDYLAVVAR